MRPTAVHPLAKQVLDEVRVSTDGLCSTDLGDVIGKRPIHDAIVLCPEAHRDCPKVAPFAQRMHYWPFPDPSQPGEGPARRRFQAVRDAIDARLATWLAGARRTAWAVRRSNRMKIAVHGLGRMGRLFLRAAWSREQFDFVAVNEPNGTAETLALGIEFDSVQGRFEQSVHASDSSRLLVGDRPLTVLQTTSFDELPWGDLGVDLVVDCSGKSKRREACERHLARGASAVLVSNPVADAPNVVYGVNHAGIDFAGENVITAASCTTNCLAPVVRVLHDAIGIQRGLVTTIHDPTNTQSVHDCAHKDPRRARSALVNLIPTTTNSATAVTMIVPELAGRIDSIAVRAPVLNSSLTDCSFEMSRDTDVDEVNAALRAAADGALAGVLGYEHRPLVSCDFARDPRSGIVDSLCTRVIDRRMAKVMAWYDNEWGYVNRMADLAECFRRART